jgi:hypothetical protein
MTDSARVREVTERLRQIVARYRAAALANRFGAQSTVLTGRISRHALPVAVFALDTGNPEAS